jgi:thioredoxin 1
MTDTEIDWPGEPVAVSDSDFKDVTAKYPYVIVDCWAPWCAPCRMVGPIIEELARDYKGQIVFGKLNTDENQATAIAHGIMSIPTMLFFKNGELVDKVIGAMPRQALEPKVKAHL